MVSTSYHNLVHIRSTDPAGQSTAIPDFLHVDHIEKAHACKFSARFCGTDLELHIQRQGATVEWDHASTTEPPGRAEMRFSLKIGELVSSS
jgi:hypothetical protein